MIVPPASADSQLLCAITSIDRQRGTGELAGDAGSGRDGRELGETLRMGFEQMGLSEIYVNPGAVEIARKYEAAGFRRDASGIDAPMSLSEPDWRALCGRGPKVALMQPQFLPWLGYLELAQRADVFVFLDDFQLVRRSWGQRNRLFVVRGHPGMVTLPVAHQGNQESTFLELREAETTVWRRKLLNLLIQNYRGAPYGEAALELVREWFGRSYANIADLEIALVEKVTGYLGLRPRFVRSSMLGIEGIRRSARLRAILEQIGAGTYLSAYGSFSYMKEDGVFPIETLPVYFQNHTPREYPQHGSSEFIPRLSCLDAIANLPPDEVRARLKGTEWWLSWDERSVSDELAVLR